MAVSINERETILRSFLFGLSLLLVSGISLADCQSENDRLMKEMNQFMERLKTSRTSGSSGGMGMCQMSRESERVYSQMEEFYQRCPVMDPDGGMVKNSREMVQWARETQRQTCN